MSNLLILTILLSWQDNISFALEEKKLRNYVLGRPKIVKKTHADNIFIFCFITCDHCENFKLIYIRTTRCPEKNDWPFGESRKQSVTSENIILFLNLLREGIFGSRLTNVFLFPRRSSVQSFVASSTTVKINK